MYGIFVEYATGLAHPELLSVQILYQRALSQQSGQQPHINKCLISLDF